MKGFLRFISTRELVAIAFGVLMASFLWAMYYIHVPQSSCKGLEEYLKPAFSSYMMADLDSLAPGNPKYSIPEKIEIIRTQQQLVLNREAELINDFRQEMNNNINKMNTWLAFAIGIMSVVGVFIPVILQINLRRDDEAARRTFYAGIVRKRNEIIKEIKDHKESAQKQVNDKINELCDDFDQSKKSFEDNLHLQNLLVNFLSFKHGCDDNILKNQPDRDLLMRFVWCKAVDAFDAVMNDCLSDKHHGEECRARLLISMVMMYSMVEKLKSSLYTRRLRDLDSITGQIKKIIVEIEFGQRNTMYWESIINDIKAVEKDIQALCSIFN